MPKLRMTGLLFSVLGILMTALTIGGCKRASEPLRVGVNVWPGFEPLFLARSLGFYDGQPIELISLPSCDEVIRAYRNGTINVAAVTADEALRIAEQLPNQRIILACDFSNGADVILAKPKFKTMAALRGRRIGVDQNTLGAYVLSRALQITGMTPADVTVVPVWFDEHEEAYAADKVDAVVTFEPRRTHLLAVGAKAVFDSSQIPGEIVDVLLTHRELLEKGGAAYQTLVKGWFRGLDYLRKQPQDAARRIAPREQMSPEAFLASLHGIELPDREANVRLLGSSADNLGVTLRLLQTLMIQTRLLSRTNDVSLLLDDRLVRKETQ